jgi:hypothetical protein
MELKVILTLVLSSREEKRTTVGNGSTPDHKPVHTVQTSDVKFNYFSRGP